MNEQFSLQGKKIDYVITGQQIGLLGGPLYTIYKILTTIHLAKKLKATPIFWMELNDADFQEINHFYYLDSHHELVKKEWKKNTGGKRVGDVEVDESLIPLITGFLDQFPGELSQKWREKVLHIYQPGRMLKEIAPEILSSILKNFEIQFFNPMEPSFLAEAQELLLREFKRTPAGEQCNGFILKNGRREALFRTENGFVLRSGEKIQPENYLCLPNYKTRPLIQDRFFINSIYVAGPNEMNYLSGLSDLYQYHQVKQSILVPRKSLTILSKKAYSELKEFRIKPEDFMRFSINDLFQNIILQKEGFSLREIKEKISLLRENFIQEVSEFPIEMKHIDYQLKKQIKDALGGLKKRLKQKYGREFECIRSLSNFLYPGRKPQERIFNTIFMELYMEEENLIQKIYEAIEKDEKIVEM
jgi:uncharacterized protein YllA (UPF0747 family)